MNKKDKNQSKPKLEVEKYVDKYDELCGNLVKQLKPTIQTN